MISLFIGLYFELTAHQLIHVNAIIDQCEKIQVMDEAGRNRLADGYEVSPNKMVQFAGKLLAKAQEVKDTGTWPPQLEGKHPTSIQDLLEDLSK